MARLNILNHNLSPIEIKKAIKDYSILHYIRL